MIVKRTIRQPEKEGPLNVAFYIRVSSDKQARKQDGSLDTQMDLLTNFVNYKCSTGSDWRVGERFVEGECEGRRRGKSAKDTNRPTFQKMLQAAHAGLIDVIVITRIDRISRSVVDFLLLVEDLDRHGVKVVSLRENIDLTTPTGKFQTILMIALAQHEREMISTRVQEKVEWRASRGMPIGPPPIGYRMLDKAFAVDEEYAKHVQACDRIYLEKQSTEAVVREFSRLGYRTPAGRAYTVAVICRMLRNPTYVGKLAYRDALYDAQWKPIRSAQTHERIVGILDRNRVTNHSPNRQAADYVYLLQGLLRCGGCGHMMSPAPAVGRNGRHYAYYACGTAEKSSGTGCPFRYIPADAADQAVLEFMKKLVLKPEVVEAFAKRANQCTSQTLGRLHEDLDRVRRELGVVKGKLSNLVDALTAGGGKAMASVQERLHVLEAERTELEVTEKRLKAEVEAEGVQEIAVQDQIRTLRFFDELVRTNEDKPERIKMLLPRFIDTVVWRSREKGQGDIEVALFPNPIAEAASVTVGPPEADGAKSNLAGIVSSEPQGWYARQDLNLQPSGS